MARDLVGEILEAARVLASRLSERQADVARSCGQTRAAAQLLRAVAQGGGSVSQLARALGLSRQAVQRVADGLVDHGLATYEKNPHHRRSPRLELTARGRATKSALEREAARRAPEVEQDMEPEELETALYVLRALREML